MRKIKLFILSIFICFSLSSCSNPDGLDEYRENGQYVELDYETFDQMLTNNEDFVFVLTRKNCSSCNALYPVIKEFLSINPNIILYYLPCDLIDKEVGYSLTLVSYFNDILGNEYYNSLGLDMMELWTPAFGKVVDGVFVNAYINNHNISDINYLFQQNYDSFNYYYAFTQKTANQEINSFKMFFSLNQDENYDLFLRNYYKENDEKEGYYLDCSNLNNQQIKNLKQRINYFLGENNKISNLSDYFYIEYLNGSIVDYQEVKFDEEGLNNLYANN